ncbi:hypothetical protein [Nocardia heshunensis]
MSPRRASYALTLIAAATLTTAAPAVAAPLPLEPPTPPTESVAGGLCNMDPLIGLWCFVAGFSA